MDDPVDQFALVRQLRDQKAALEGEVASLKGTGGGGTSGGMSSDWKASVDRQLGTLHEDFRKLVGWLIAAVSVPLIAIIGLYVYTGTKSDAATVRMDLLANQVAAVRVDQERQRGDNREAAAQMNGKLDLLVERRQSASARR